MLIKLHKPVFGPLLSHEIALLKKDGIIITPEEAVWLWQMCAEIARPNARTASQVFNLPIRLGTKDNQVFLYRPTVAGRIWFDETCKRFLSGFSAHFQILTMGFYYSIGPDYPRFNNLITKQDIEREVIAWGRTLPITIDELKDGIRLLNGDKPETEEIETDDGRVKPIKEASPCDYGEIYAFLCHYYGVSISELMSVPDDTMEAMLDALPALMQANHPIEGKTTETPSDSAYWKMKQCVKIIRQTRTQGMD